MENDFYCCCFMNVQMACKSAGVFVWPFEVCPFNLNAILDLDPSFPVWKAA